MAGTKNFSLLYTPGSLALHGYYDADWAGDLHDRKSTSRYCTYLGNNSIIWSSKKQTTVSCSSTEVEYHALAAITTEFCWIHMLFKELRLPISGLPVIWSDSKSAIALASYPVFYSKTKHIDIDFHFIKEKLLQQILLVCYVPIDTQQADMLTKSLCLPIFTFFRSKFRLLSPAQLEGG